MMLDMEWADACLATADRDFEKRRLGRAFRSLESACYSHHLSADALSLLARVQSRADQIALEAERDGSARLATKSRELSAEAKKLRLEVESRRVQDGRRGEAYEGALATVSECRVLGGHGLPPNAGETWELIFTADELRLFHALFEDVAVVPYADVTAIEIGGPGRTQTGGGFIGGGFGVEGAAEGMLVAAALNMLTTRTKIDTVICVQTRSAELFFHHGGMTPDALRMVLSPVFTRLRQQSAAPTAADAEDPNGQHVDVVDRLAKLADLHASGALSNEEFSAAKTKLLG
jgi:hypothetical protein